MFEWYKALHLIFMVTWFAGLFYLPRLFVYHSMCNNEDAAGIQRFKVMERKLYYGITSPGGMLTLLFGILALWENGISHYREETWLHIKLGLVILLIGYHIFCGRLLRDFKHDRNRHGHVWYRWFNEIPVALLAGIILLAVLRPQ